MTARVQTILLAAIVLIASAIPVLAHHSFAAEFDSSKAIDFSGVVTKVEWMNPHVYFYMDVKDENGKVTTWGFSSLPPGMLLRRGITKDSFKVGAIVNVEGSRARDGSA